MISTEAPSLFLEVRNWLEIAYFASGIIVMFLIGFGLRQLQIAQKQLETSKEIFKIQSKRASVEAAVVECRRFAETVVQDSIALDKYCKEHSITYFNDIKFTKTDTGFSIDSANIKKEDVDKLAEAQELINRFINGLEAYALFFLSGVADENIAFHTNAKAFLQLAETALKFCPISNIEKDDAESIKSLYFMWHKKYEAKKLKIEQREISKKLLNYKEKSIKSIGT